jgi:hypothetical protein
MSDARQHVTRSDNFRGFGYLPAFTPAHQLERETGTNLRTWLTLKSPTRGSSINSRNFASLGLLQPLEGILINFLLSKFFRMLGPPLLCVLVQHSRTDVMESGLPVEYFCQLMYLIIKVIGLERVK